MRKQIFAGIFLFGSIAATAQTDQVDTEVINKIREEGLKNSKVMDIAFYLTDANGPRLQGSPGYYKAANWAKGKLTEWGLSNPMLEPWGEWGKGWDLQRSYLAMTAPYYKPLIGYPKSWTSGTGGLKTATLLIVDPKDSLALMSYKGKLKGRVLIVPRQDTLLPSFAADASRRSEEDLKKMSAYDPKATPERPRNFGGPRGGGSIALLNKLKEMAKEEGAIAIVSATTRGRDGTLFVSGGGAYTGTSPENFLDIVVAYEDYMTLYRLASHNIPVSLEADVKTTFYSKDLKGYNVVAEIPGTDPKLKDELVMIGGHLDSWHASTGATDNAAGCAVMLEAIRILKATGVKPKRTIRIALWGGEEQGLHGSRNYVKNHFTDTTTKKFNAAGNKLSVYFNLDNGSGKIRGVYLQGNDSVRSAFTAWLAPFADLGASTLTLQNTGGTDHLSFDAIGLPAFQFIQDELEYSSRTHHTNMDSYDHLQPEDLKQAATIVAAFVYQASVRAEKLPRKAAK